MSTATNTTWLEKYRPVVLEDVLGNDDIVDRLKVFAQVGNFPNLILTGAPGIGKTTSILCLARNLLKENFSKAVLEMNASDDRGIDVIRGKIKEFANRKVTLPPNCHKIIILDEADSMTESAQQALRRVMEVYSDTTRFALACNNSEKIIEPIQSRCAILRFSKLSESKVLERVLEICEKEKITYDDSGMEAIVYTAQGDMRQAINNLQATYSAFDLVTSDNVFKICDEPPPKKIEHILNNCLNGDIFDSHKMLVDLWQLGYSASDLISNFMRVAKNLKTIPEHIRILYLKEIGCTHLLIVQGHTSLLQLAGLLSKMVDISIKNKCTN